MNTLRIALLLPLLAAFVAGINPPRAAGQEKIDKGKIVDKWEVTEADEPLLKGTTVEFTKPGTIIITLKLGDKELALVGKYEVAGSDLKFTTKGLDQKEKTDTAKIEKLSDSELVLKDDKGKVTKYKKAK